MEKCEYIYFCCISTCSTQVWGFILLPFSQCRCYHYYYYYYFNSSSCTVNVDQPLSLGDLCLYFCCSAVWGTGRGRQLKSTDDSHMDLTKEGWGDGGRDCSVCVCVEERESLLFMPLCQSAEEWISGFVCISLFSFTNSTSLYFKWASVVIHCSVWSTLAQCSFHVVMKTLGIFVTLTVNDL